MGPFSAFFCPNLGKNKFSWKIGVCQFLNILIIYHHAKNQKNLMTNSWGKCRTDRRSDGQTNNGDFIRPSVGRGSNNYVFQVFQYQGLVLSFQKVISLISVMFRRIFVQLYWCGCQNNVPKFFRKRLVKRWRRLGNTF